MAVNHSSVSPQQLEILARIQRDRRAGFIPSLNDVDTLIAILAQLTTPGHTCVDNPNLPCAACGEDGRKSA
jgi:hypothetical protein